MGHRHHHDPLHVSGQRRVAYGQNFYKRAIADDKVLETSYIFWTYANTN
jgi:hypothetical protein